VYPLTPFHCHIFMFASSCSHTGLSVCVYNLAVISITIVLHID
jgi:hypothetical protein